MKLLVYTPSFKGGLHPECEKSVLEQDYSGEWNWVVDTDDPFPPPNHKNVLAKYQRAKDIVLREGYDALVTVEHDMVLPTNALRLLVEANKPVVFGVYMLRHGSRVINAWRYEGDKNLGQSLTLFKKELERARRAGIVRVSGVAWGCTYIHRSVLERIAFRDDNGQNPAGDLAFATDCLRSGIEMYARFDVPCIHIEKGQKLYPFDDRGQMAKTICEKDVNVRIDGTLVRMKATNSYDVPLEMAKELERAGYISILPAVEVKPVRTAVKGKKPFIEVLTRSFRRPSLLNQNIESLEEQTSKNFVQTLFIDDVGIGVPAANAQFADVKPVGKYVWILDDDDLCTRPTLFEEVEKLAKESKPAVVIVRFDHSHLGILPSDETFGRTDLIKEGGIGCSSYFVRKDVWEEHKHAWKSARYASDFDFIREVLNNEKDVVWHDVVAGRVQKISHGKMEV